MASEDEAPPMESIPVSEEILPEVERDMKRAETPRVQETPAQLAQKSPPRNGIPPKRLLAASKRTSMSSPSTTMKPTSSSISRKDPANGLSKPPTRPTPTSSVRRPATNVTASSAPRLGHKPRSSISSVDEGRRGDMSGSEENLKSSSNSAAKRMAISGTTATRSPARPTVSSATTSTSRMSTLASTTDIDSKSVSSRAATGNSSKPVLRNTTNNPRPISTPGTARNTRPAVISTKNAAESDLAKKRLSTIAASPASLQHVKSISNSKSSPAKASGKQVRPGLLTRKSTMSVTIEQRLQEMEIVHKMLTAAMTDDGIEDDEIREEYGKTADDTLASLRARLEEARLKEGDKDSSEPRAHADGSNVEAKTQPIRDSRQTQSNLSENTQKVSNLEAELAGMKEKMLQYIEAADRASKDVEEMTERMSKEQASKIDELSANHSQEVMALRAALDETDLQRKHQLESSLKDLEEARRIAEVEGSKKVAEVLELKRQEHAQNTTKFEDDLAEERRKRLNAASRLEQLEAELSILKGLLSEEQQKSDRLAQDAQTQQENAIKELHEALDMKDIEMSNLETETQNLQMTHSRELEELESAASAKESQLEAEIRSLRSRLRDLENVTNASSGSHNEAIQTMDQEILQQSRVIEDLQNRIQQLHEVKEREIDEVRSNLIQEHEQSMSKAQLGHEIALSSLRDAAQEKSQETVQLHEREMESLREEHKLSLDKLDKQSAEITLLKTESETSTVAIRSAAANEINDYKHRLEETKGSLEETKQALERTQKTLASTMASIGSLESERDKAIADRLSAQQALGVVSGEVTSLKKTLETLENASSANEQQNATALQKMKYEIDAASRALVEKTKEHSSISETHLQDLKDVRARHSKEVKALKKENREALRALQKTFDDLLVKHEEAEKENARAMNALVVENLAALEQQSKAHQRLNTAHAEEMKNAQSQIRESKRLQEQQQEDVCSLRKELEDSQAAQEKHETVLAELELQLEKQSEILARTEQRLQEAQALPSKENSKQAGEAAQEMEELRRLLADAQSKAALDKEAIDRLTAAIEEASGVSLNVAEAERLREKISELTEQHAAEISKLQETSSLGNDKREEERKHEAEIREQLTKELEKLTTAMAADQDKLEYQRQALDFNDQRATEIDQQLSNSRILEERLQLDLQKTLAELEALQAEVDSAALEAERAESTSASQMLEVLRAAADEEREKNADLKEQLRQAELAIDKHAIRVREVESALKVTTAELVEMRTERRGGSEYAGSYTPKSVLRSSLWPVPDSSDLGDTKTAMMAGMQEQIRQLEDVNEDMLQDSERLVRLMARVTEPKYNVKSNPEISAEETEEEEL